MVCVKNGIGVNMRGRLGNVIFYTRGGRTYARSCPQKVHNPKTPLQQQQRSRMSDVSAFYKVVRQSRLYGIWRQAADCLKMGGMNLFVKINIAAFSGNGRVTDYEKLHFSYGVLPSGDCFRAIYQAATASVDICWQNVTLLSEERYADRFMAVVLFERDEFTVFAGREDASCRRDCVARLCLPEGHPPPLKIYCFFAAIDDTAYSGDVCCHLDR